jgi:archaeosine synthase beta-subunit
MTESGAAEAPDERSAMLAAPDEIEQLYREFGQRKPMGAAAPSTRHPHYFLLRSFLGENDLLVILNTKRCRYRCHFCTLPEKSSRKWVADEEVVAQFLHVARACRHALSIVGRVTLSNEGSVLDGATLGPDALNTIVSSIGRMRRVRRIDLETRLEFVVASRLRHLTANPAS